MDLHPDLAPVAWLVGAWAGEGEGWYPTIADFRYHEEVTWSSGGKPLLAYQQRTWSLDDGRPMHSECGYLRVVPGGLELVIAHANGITEISVGDINGAVELRSCSMGGTPSAKDVRTVDRRMWLDGRDLCYELGMEAVGVARAPHLRARLAPA
jgi:hypothetical protein